MKTKWKRTGAIIHARSGECAPVVCIASSVEHARLIAEAKEAIELLKFLTPVVIDEFGFSDEKIHKATVKAEQLIKRAAK